MEGGEGGGYSQYADGHFNQNGLYTGEQFAGEGGVVAEYQEGGEYHHQDGTYTEGSYPDGGEYTQGGEGEEFQTNNAFCPLNQCLDRGGLGVSALAFDSHEELLWMGNLGGHVTSYYGTSLQQYTSFQVHPTEAVRSLLTMERGVLALSQTSLRCQIRRGLPAFTHHSANMMEMQCMLRYNQRPTQLLMGGIQEKMISFDLVKGKETQVVDTGGTCAVLRYHGRYVGCGDTSGKIQLRDPHSLTLQHTLDTHSGTLSDFDMNGHYLVTCGFARRHGNLQAVDRFLMVYDLRILRATSPIQCMVEPCQLRFLPSDHNNRIVVLSSAGQVQLVDTLDVDHNNLDVFQVDSGGGMTLSMDISPSNHCLAVGDENSCISVYSQSSNSEPSFNLFPRETEFADHLPTFTTMAIDDPRAIYSSIPLPHLPPGETTYASDNWPARFAKEAYRPVPPVDPAILAAMKMVGTIGYAPNIGNKKRNVMEYNLKRSVDKENIDSNDPSQGKDKDIYKSPVPKRYKKNDIKLGKMGQDDFDFDHYNKTSFCGLEASLPNSYCNAMLQVLYFTEKLRVIILNHFCSRESCLACELSFLFHMLDTGHGFPCQPANFLRALRTIPEASALGLIFSEASSMWRTSVPRLIQSWNRFLLQQIHLQCTDAAEESRETQPPSLQLSNNDWSRSSPAKRTAGESNNGMSKEEYASISRDMADVLSGDGKAAVEAAEESPVAELLGMRQDKITKCGKCKVEITTDNLLLLCNLQYPEHATLRQKIDFGQVLCSSLCPEQMTPAWCERCRKYQPTSQCRRLQSLPYTLSINTGMDNPGDVAFWNTQMTIILEESEGRRPGSEPPTSPGKAPTPPAGQKACRYGGSCTRPDCKFWHAGQELMKEPALDVGDQLAKIQKSWIPFDVTLHLAEDGTVHYSADVEGKVLKESRTYHLYAVTSNVVDPVTPEASSLVSCVKVGPSYHARIGSPVSQWYIFNDFTITPIPQQEATWFNLKWKIPSILNFAASEVPKSLADLEYKNPITVDIFAEDKNVVQRVKRTTFTPLGQEELPKKGDLVAIDAEFVTLNQEEAELRSDGKVSTVKAAHMSVARITCVRGEGGMEGVPFIDDYISTQEQVVDYLTKFSGIKPGDLDANFSSKHLTTLKSTYQKLRFLVDCGCIFIGHGLKNDFRVINLVVPMEQTIDTVHLFHLPHHRWVSLKFLAWHFLNTRIQGVTHDSTEDAVTSLRLYRKHLELKKEGKVMEALTKMYDLGKELNWKIPDP